MGLLSHLSPPGSLRPRICKLRGMHNIPVVRTLSGSWGVSSRGAGFRFFRIVWIPVLAIAVRAQEAPAPAPAETEGATHRYGYQGTGETPPPTPDSALAPVARVRPVSPQPEPQPAEAKKRGVGRLLGKLLPGDSKNERAPDADTPETPEISTGEKPRKGLLKRLLKGREEGSEEAPASVLPEMENIPPPEAPGVTGADVIPETLEPPMEHPEPPQDDSDQWTPVSELVPSAAPAPAVAEKETPQEKREPAGLPGAAFGPVDPSRHSLLSDEPQLPTAGAPMPEPQTLEGYSVLEMLTGKARKTPETAPRPEEKSITTAPGKPKTEIAGAPAAESPKSEESAKSGESPKSEIEAARFVVVNTEEGTDFETAGSGTQHLEKGTILKKLSTDGVTTYVRLRDYREGAVATGDLRAADMKESLSFFRLTY